MKVEKHGESEERKEEIMGRKESHFTGSINKT